MSRLTYWQRVNLQAEIDAQNQAASSIRRVLRYYKKAFSDIESDIADIFGSMANHAELTMEQAKEMIRISKKYDIRELRELLKHTKEPETRAAIEQLINAQAYGARIHRLEAVRANLYIHLAKAAKREIEDIRGLFGDVFKDGYYSTVYHTAKEANIGVDFSLIPERAVEQAMNAPWHGKSFSARVWEHTDEVAGRAQKIVVSGLQKGTSTARMARELSEAMHTSEFYADRLIRTQTNHFLNLGTLKGYEETDVETYTYLATLDGRTCERCWPLDGKVFLVTEATEGVNYPTMHPFCRCTTTPGSRRANTRIARDPESGESYKVDGGTDFETWYQTLPKEKREALEKYARAGNQAKMDLTNTSRNDIIDKKGVAGGQDVHYIGKINRDIYKCVTTDIKTDDVIITDTQIQHIKDRHPHDYERYFKYAEEILRAPDYILEANKPNTAFILKHIEDNGKNYEMILRLQTSNDPADYKNSVITFLKVEDKRYKRYLRTKKILYKSE